MSNQSRNDRALEILRFYKTTYRRVLNADKKALEDGELEWEEFKRERIGYFEKFEQILTEIEDCLIEWEEMK